jgi:hypothetical protein
MAAVKPAVKARGDEILKRIKGIKRPIVAEIGVATGNLSKYLLRMRKDLELYMVDNWRAEADQPDHYRATRDTNAHVTAEKQEQRKASAYLLAREFKGRAEIIETDSVSAAGRCPDSLDLVFIDADHSYEGVKADIKAWRGKVKPGGWLGGHDYANTDPRFAFGVTQAVDEVFEKVELGANFTWWVRI